MPERSIRPLTASDLNELERLLSLVVAPVHPHLPVAGLTWEELIPAFCGLLEPRAEGIFRDGRLLAAARWGRVPTGEGRDYGNIRGGDGLIPWLLFDDADAAGSLLGRIADDMPGRLYAFPEGGELRTFLPFGTGMLPVSAEAATSFFQNHGFVLPEGEAWGVQERIFMHLRIPERWEVPDPAEGLRVETSGEGLKRSFKLHLADNTGERVVGESSLAPAVVRGREMPGTVFVCWLGVDETVRGKGLGRFLLAAAIETVRQAGATDILLTTHAGRPAWRLYERMGFVEVDRARSYALER